MSGDSGIDRVAELREAFDRGFAETPSEVREETVNFLRIRIGAQAFAVPLSEISGVLADKRITPLPSAASALLGVAAHRGDIVPVFSLRALLSHGDEEHSRWLMLAGDDRVAGFAFDHFEGHVRVAAADVAPAQPAAAGKHIRASVRIAGELCPIVSVDSLMEELSNGVGST